MSETLSIGGDEVDEKEGEPQYTAAEGKARKAGWAPLEEWRGAEENWIDFDVFNMRGEFMDRVQEQSSIISHLTTKVNDRDTVIENLSSLQDKLTEKAYNDALKTLKSQKKDALEEADYDTVVELDDELADLKAKQAATEVAPQQTQATVDDQTPQEIVDWLSRPEQSWYHQDYAMRGMCEGIAGAIRNNNQNITPAQLIQEVDAEMKKQLPHKFQQAGGVDEGGGYNTPPSRNGRIPGWGDLTEEQQQVARTFEKVGTMSRKEYIKSLVELGELQ